MLNYPERAVDTEHTVFSNQTLIISVKVEIPYIKDNIKYK